MRQVAGQVADEPTIIADTGQPKVPFLLRRSGETRVLHSPLTVEQAMDRFALYLGDGKRRQEYALVQGRTVVAKGVGRQVQVNSYRRYLVGVLATAFCILDETAGGTQVLVTLSTLRYRRVYSVTALLAVIIGILIFAPATELWIRALLVFGILLIASNWRLARPTRVTVEETRFLGEFVRNLLEAEVVSVLGKRGMQGVEVAMAKGRSR
jgi:hypothetical protein